MARNLHMSWIPSQKRWMKMYRGKRYAVSCRQLNVPATKEDSWRAANEWWEAKQATVDAAARPAADPVIATAVEVVQNGGGANLLEQSQKGAAAMNLLILLEDFVQDRLDDPAAVDAACQALLEAYRAGTLPKDLVENITGGEVSMARAFQGSFPLLLEGATAPPDRTVGGQASRWVATQQALVGAGKITPDRADNNRICLYHFRDFLGSKLPLESVNEERLHDFFLHCLGKVEAGRRASSVGANKAPKGAKKLKKAAQKLAGEDEDKRGSDKVKAKECWSVDYAKKVFGVARAFIRFLWESRLIELPRNIESKAFRFGAGAKAVKTWTVDEFKVVLGKATGQLRLHLLLMANCGMLQTDISDLRDDQVDWQEGRIIRKRSKTETSEEVPVVNYKLWPQTFELLKQYRSGGNIVLLTESGCRWVDKRMVDGRLVKADNIASCYVWLKKRAKFRKPLKQIRKTSASIIESHPEYGRYKSHFLGHSPRTLADRHYAAPSPELFDRIMTWLGQQYGFCPAAGS